MKKIIIGLIIILLIVGISFFINNPINTDTVLIAQNTPQSVLAGLNRFGIKILFGGKINYSVEAVRFHIDTQIAHIEENKFVVSPHL